MLDLLIMVVFGTVFAYFATQNTGGVDVRLAGYMWTQIPLYIVVLSSLIVGLVLASFLHYIDQIFLFLKIQRKNTQIKATEHTVDSLQGQINRLEAENAKLRGEKTEIKTEERIHDKIHHPSIADKIRKNLT